MCPDRYKMWCGLFKNYRMTLKFLDFYFFSIRNKFPVSFFFLLCVLVRNHAFFWVILTKINLKKTFIYFIYFFTAI